jgi:AcrR family transcriptional regulator
VSRPRRLPAEERRRTIVQAALRVFSSGSYSGSTIAEIARDAGVSEPVVYRHFQSKRDLWAACLDEAWEEFRAGFDGVVEELIATSGDRDGGDGGVVRGGLLVPPAVARWKKALMPNLWIQGITEAGEDREIRRHVARHMRVAHDHVAAALRRGQEVGVIPADRSPEVEAWMMIAGGLLRSVADRVGGLLDDDDLAAIQRERMRWLLGEPATGSPSAVPRT